MTRKQAGIPKLKLPTRATKRRSLNFYWRSMQGTGGGQFRDSYGQIYRRINGGLVALRP